MFNIRGPVSYKNITGSLLACVLGAIVSLYQWSQLLINDGVSYAPKVLSLPMYIWAAMLFFGVAIVLFILSFFMKDNIQMEKGLFSTIGYYLFFLMVISQIIVTFNSCGLLLC